MFIFKFINREKNRTIVQFMSKIDNDDNEYIISIYIIENLKKKKIAKKKLKFHFKKRIKKTKKNVISNNRLKK